MPGKRPAGEIYIPLAAAFASDPKVRALSQYGADAGLARDLFVQMICHCKMMLTDGFVAEYELGILVYPLDLEHGKQLAKQLASVGLIKDEAGGWRLLAYLKRNGSREDVERLSEVRAESGRRGGSVSRKQPRQGPAQANRKQVAVGALKQNEARDRDRDRGIPTTSGADAAPNPGLIVAAFVEGAIAAGRDAPASTIKARIGRQARELLAEGKPFDRLEESARHLGAGEWNDLAVQLRKDDPGAQRNGTPARKTNYADEEYSGGWNG